MNIKFLELTLLNENKIFINADSIQTIQRDDNSEDTEVCIDGMIFCVKEMPKQIIEKIEQ